MSALPMYLNGWFWSIYVHTHGNLVATKITCRYIDQTIRFCSWLPLITKLSIYETNDIIISLMPQVYLCLENFVNKTVKKDQLPNSLNKLAVYIVSKFLIHVLHILDFYLWEKFSPKGRLRDKAVKALALDPLVKNFTISIYKTKSFH